MGREDAADITKKEGREKKTPSEEHVDVEVYCYTFLYVLIYHVSYFTLVYRCVMFVLYMYSFFAFYF